MQEQTPIANQLIEEQKASKEDRSAHNQSKEACRLREILLLKTSDQTIIDEAIKICEDAGSIKHACKVADELRLKLTNKVDSVFINPVTRNLMKQLIDMIAYRKH